MDHDAQVRHWLGRRIPGAMLDNDGMAYLMLDETTLLTIEIPPDSEVCHFYAPVTPLSEEAPEADLYHALTLNRFGRPLGGCWLAWDPDFAMLTLCHNLHIPSSDEISFGNTLDNFIAALLLARREMANHGIDVMA